MPAPSAVAVPSTVVPLVSNSVTVAPASAPLPVNAGMVTLVMLSVLDEPVSVAAVMSGAAGAAAVVSSVKLSDAVPVLPNESVWLATIVCDPSDSPVGVNDQTPAPFAVVVPRTVAPSLSVTSVLAAPDPVSASFEVMLSLADKPVSVVRRSITVGPTVLSV